jgi:hypothetical protein
VYEKRNRPSARKTGAPLSEPPRSEEELEKLCISEATDMALEQLRNRTASSQIIVHYLRLGSLKEQAELEKTKNEIELLKAKKKSLEADEERTKKYQEVIDAITSYMGKDSEWEAVEDDYPGM